jgi:DNA-binding MarR family transcriptional regulator
MASVGDQAWAITTLVEAADLLAGEAERRLREQVGLSLAEKEVLFRLSLAGGSMRMTELAQALLFTAGGATRIVDRMVRAGLVDRAGVEGDRRATVVVITPSGRRQFARTGPVMEVVVRDLFEPYVTDDDVAALTRILSRIVVGSGRWADRAAGMDFERSIRRAGQPSVRTRA